MVCYFIGEMDTQALFAAGTFNCYDLARLLLYCMARLLLNGVMSDSFIHRTNLLYQYILILFNAMLTYGVSPDDFKISYNLVTSQTIQLLCVVRFLSKISNILLKYSPLDMYCLLMHLKPLIEYVIVIFLTY